MTFVNHDVTAMMFNYSDSTSDYKIRTGTIKIGDNVFAGANTMILYDVVIGNNVIIGAGSLMNRNTLDGSIVAGVPCKFIGKYEDYKSKVKEGNKNGNK